MSISSDANSIAKYFITKTANRATPAIMKKTHSQAKTLLQNNYTKEEIIKTIDFVIDDMQIEIYSIGYIHHCINDVLNKIKKKELQEKALQNKAAIAKEIEEYQHQQSEVVKDANSGQRNQTKAKQLGIQSRKRKELISDLFEGNRQID